MSTFNVGDKVRQLRERVPYQSVGGLIGVVVDADSGPGFGISVEFPGIPGDFPFAAVELELVHE